MHIRGTYISNTGRASYIERGRKDGDDDDDVGRAGRQAGEESRNEESNGTRELEW